MTSKELDASFDLPYTRVPHPKYKNKRIPAYEMIKFSVNIHRGCFGGCAFCTISAHQGKFITCRSKESIIKEVRQVIDMPDFKGYLSDLGGPSANMYGMRGRNINICEKCKRPSCINPQICPNLNTDHSALTDIYRTVDKLPGIKKSFIGSGVRYDLLLHRSDNEKTNKAAAEYTRELICKHVSGRLKVAPEHTSDNVLRLMRKPPFRQFDEFKRIFDRINREENLNQQIIPYFISSHPGCSEADMAELAVKTKAGFPPRTDTRLHAHSNDGKHRDMVYRLRPVHHGTGIQRKIATGKTCPAPVFLLVQARRKARYRAVSQTYRATGTNQRIMVTTANGLPTPQRDTAKDRLTEQKWK